MNYSICHEFSNRYLRKHGHLDVKRMLDDFVRRHKRHDVLNDSLERGCIAKVKLPFYSGIESSWAIEPCDSQTFACESAEIPEIASQ